MRPLTALLLCVSLIVAAASFVVPSYWLTSSDLCRHQRPRLYRAVRYDRISRHHLIRTGRIRRPRRIYDRPADYGAFSFALAVAAGQHFGDCIHGLRDRSDNSSAVRPLSCARHFRLEYRTILRVC